MASAPQIALRTGTGFTTNLVFTTNEESIFINGTVDNNTAAIQVSVNGGQFVSDPTLILLTLNAFTIPNPNNYPSGLLLNIGDNTIQIRTVDIVGGLSPLSTVLVTRVATITNLAAQIPTGISVQRNRNTVDVLAAVPTLDPSSTLQFLGFNYYASTAAGGTTGYFLLNSKPVTAASTQITEVIPLSVPFGTTWAGAAPTTRFVRVQVTTEDQFQNQLTTQLDQRIDVRGFFNNYRVNGTFQDFQQTTYIDFTHDRTGAIPGTINSEQFVSVPNNNPLYYVVTAVYFDSPTSTEIETPFSQEVLGTPLIIDTAIKDLPTRTQLQITLDYIRAIQRVNTEISLIPGSTTRDVSIDPFASEAERIWFLIDFVHRSQSFLTLLQIDDPGNTGASVAVSASAYKTALQAAVGYNSTTATQQLIDTQFDKLAANDDKFRLPGRPSTGQVVVFTATAPTQDLTIPSGTVVSTNGDSTTNTPAQTFVIGGTFVLPAANALAFFNFDTKQYEVTVDIVAQNIGVAGNVSAGTIVNITGVSGVQVTNRSATVFGTDIETNSQLASRAILGFVSVDTGTEGGYQETAASQIGIIKAKVVKSGDTLMMRDYDPVRMKHIGGKVDIWVQGIQEATVQDTFAFSFGVALGVQIKILDVTNLIFEVLDSRVTPTSPIIEILNNTLQNLGVFNATAAQAYDLTGVTILTYNTFQINAALSDQPVTHLDDVIFADYRFRIANQFFFTLQPVRRVVSVVGQVSGPLDTTHGFFLYKTDDPLLNGESTIAQNFLQVIQFNGIPSGNTIQVNNESHVLIGFQNEPLDSIGINTATIAVFNSTRTIQYAGPGSATPDYEIVQGTPTTPAAIVRTANSTIVNGSTVSVDYVHDENFTVTYVINELLQQLQQVINNMRHVTADVLVKQAIQNFVNLETTVQLKSGATKANVDPNIRTAVSLALDTKTIGQGIAQSNVDAAINDTSGVAFNVLPMALMGYADGSIKLRESLVSSFEHLSTLDIGGNRVFILTQELANPTTDSGGTPQEHHGVFQDDVMFTMATTLSQVGAGSKQSWIIGAEGAIIQGYSDDATLAAQGFLPDQIVAERLRLTANHALVSLSGAGLPPDNPGNHVYTVSYVIRGEIGSQDITAASVEFIDLGNFTITYRAATT
jgi:Baseplate J-like protein